MADEEIQKTVERIHRGFARICAAVDQSSWMDGKVHARVETALGKIADPQAREVLTELVGMVGVVDRRISNVYAGTKMFKGFLDKDFQALLDKQEQDMAKPTDPGERAIATLQLAEVLTTAVEADSRASLVRDTASVDDIGTAFAKFLGGA